MMNHNKSTWKLAEIIFIIAALIFTLVWQGVVPFLMMPVLSQAVWGTGFAESFAHGSFFSIHAHDIGIPRPAAISFGLAGAWPISLLLRLGLHAADAYSITAMSWMSVAFFSAYMMARRCGNSRYLATLGAVMWMSTPMIWGHAGYGFLSFGMSLLALYFLAAEKLFCVISTSQAPARSTIALYFFVAIIAAFMDGYTFMMFACGATLLFLVSLIQRVDFRPVLWRKILPVHIASFIIAYALYCWFIGKAHYAHASLDFFRGWSVDVLFTLVPTRGVHWVLDAFGFSSARSPALYFGDASVWMTTFTLPIVLLGVISWCFLRKKFKMATSILVVGVFGFYMSLGPALKIHSTKIIEPNVVLVPQTMPLMLPKYALMPTGNGVLSKHIPGFNDMRAAYRWTALEVFAFWWLVMLAAAKTRKQKVWAGMLFVVILLNFPHLPKKLQMDKQNRVMFLQIDQELVPMLKHVIQPNDVVAFLPWGNDWLANYLAPTVGFRTYNIGGDKNTDTAKLYWPQEMQAAGPAPLDAIKMSAGLTLLRDGKADVLVIPYFDLLWSAHIWPCGKAAPVVSQDPYACLQPYKQSLQLLLDSLKASPDLRVMESTLFVTVRTKTPQTPLKTTI